MRRRRRLHRGDAVASGEKARIVGRDSTIFMWRDAEAGGNNSKNISNEMKPRKWHEIMYERKANAKFSAFCLHA